MRLFDSETAFTISPSNIHQVLYRSEQSRGYPFEGDLWSPGFFHVDLRKTDCGTLVASTERWEIIEVLCPEEALAAEQQRRVRLLKERFRKRKKVFQPNWFSRPISSSFLRQVARRSSARARRRR